METQKIDMSVETTANFCEDTSGKRGTTGKADGIVAAGDVIKGLYRG